MIDGGSSSRAGRSAGDGTGTARRRLGSVVQAGCTISVITLIVFVLVNLALSPFAGETQDVKAVRPTIGWSTEAAQKWIDHYGLDTVRRVYPGKSDDEIRKIIFNKFQVGNRYEPFVEFLPDPIFMHDPVFNVDMGIHEAGFRLGGRDQGPWPIDKSKLNVFVFGGSTTFGTGAADDETIPAFLQKYLREEMGPTVDAYNFGVGAYYSSQELINFWRLARQGDFPDLVVFVDGLNDYFQTTEDTAHSGYYRTFEAARVSLLKQLQLDRGSLWHLAAAVELSPVFRFVENLKQHQLPTETPGAENLNEGKRTVLRTFDAADEKHVVDVTNRLLNNFRLASGMADSIGAESAFIVQPTPMYDYDLSRHPFPVPEWHQYTRIGYPLLKQRLESGTGGPEHVVWCASLGEDAPANVPLYVDPVHYSAAMNKLIARCIIAGLRKDGSFDRLADKIRKKAG